MHGRARRPWPPLLATSKPTAGTGLTTSKLATIIRSGEAQHVTYNGESLYLFAKDHNPGSVSGRGVTAFGAAWVALTPTGNQIAAQPTSSVGALSSGGGRC